MREPVQMKTVVTRAHAQAATKCYGKEFRVEVTPLAKA